MRTPLEPGGVEQTDRDDMADAIRHTEKRSRKIPRIDRLRAIVDEKAACRMEGLLVDLFTASMLVQVYDALNETNREKFVKLSLRRMVDVGWKAARGK